MKIRREAISPPRIEMLPLIDIVFLLLVFFIYAMLSMAVHHGLQVDLPKSGTAALDTSKAIGITVTHTEQDVQIFLDEKPVSLDQLSTTLKSRGVQQTNEDSTTVQIFADKDIAYQELFKVLDAIQQAGLSNISLQAEQNAISR